MSNFAVFVKIFFYFLVGVGIYFSATEIYDWINNLIIHRQHLMMV